MHRHETSIPAPPGERAAPKGARSEWRALAPLLPYLWEFRGRVMLAFAFLVGAKLANVGVPLIMKEIVDLLSVDKALVAAPLVLLLGYGLLRMSTTLFTELRELVFAKVEQRAVRRVALQVFRHLHSLSLRFHLDRQTGGASRDLQRGTRAISSLLGYAVYSIFPTLVEISLVTGILLVKYEIWFTVITAVTLTGYIGYTVTVTEWRTKYRRQMNEQDSRASTRAIDSLLNYETVKYFGNEQHEARRYDEGLQHYESAAVKSQTALSALNVGQASIVAVGVTLVMWRATSGGGAGTGTPGG